jgi:signal peptidase II
MISSIKNLIYKAANRVVSHPVKTALVTCAADLATKAAVQHYLPYNTKYCLIENAVCVQKILNQGYVFGQTGEYHLGAKLLFAAGLTAIAAKMVKARSKITALSLALFGAGAVGNLVDRAMYGGVTDFIKLGSWYNFNVADAALTSSLMLLLYEMVAKKPTS